MSIESFTKHYILPQTIKFVNETYSPQRLIRRFDEPIPEKYTGKSSYRSRIGIIMEGVLGDKINEILSQSFSNQFTLTNNLVNEFPDFYIRDQSFNIKMGLDIKCVHRKSEEKSARFDTLIKDLKEDDFLLLISWDWKSIGDASFPYILDHALIKAIPIAKERDKRLRITGGCIQDGKVYIKSKKDNKMIKDNHNFGKLNRLIHESRINQLFCKDVEEYIKFTKKLD